MTTPQNPWLGVDCPTEPPAPLSQAAAAPRSLDCVLPALMGHPETRVREFSAKLPLRSSQQLTESAPRHACAQSRPETTSASRSRTFGVSNPTVGLAGPVRGYRAGLASRSARDSICQGPETVLSKRRRCVQPAMSSLLGRLDIWGTCPRTASLDPRLSLSASIRTSGVSILESRMGGTGHGHVESRLGIRWHASAL